MFIANCCKSPQIAKIATYAGFADPDFRLQQRAQKKNPDVAQNPTPNPFLYKRN